MRTDLARIILSCLSVALISGDCYARPISSQVNDDQHNAIRAYTAQLATARTPEEKIQLRIALKGFNPTDLNNRMELAGLDAGLNHWDESKAELTEALGLIDDGTIKPSSYEDRLNINMMLAQAYIQTGDYSTAAYIYSDIAHGQSRFRVSAIDGLAICYIKQNQRANAVDVYEQAASQFSNDGNEAMAVEMRRRADVVRDAPQN